MHRYNVEEGDRSGGGQREMEGLLKFVPVTIKTCKFNKCLQRNSPISDRSQSSGDAFLHTKHEDLRKPIKKQSLFYIILLNILNIKNAFSAKRSQQFN